MRISNDNGMDATARLEAKKAIHDAKEGWANFKQQLVCRSEILQEMICA